METNLAIDKAAQLYGILGKYIPNEALVNPDYLDFTLSIINNIQNGNNQQDYFAAIQLMTGSSLNVLQESSSEDILLLFMRALVEWRIIELVDFFREIGH